ncbi:MAG: hypothetical protein RLN76_05040 [Phycisphaeraceae bacterium]
MSTRSTIRNQAGVDVAVPTRPVSLLVVEPQAVAGPTLAGITSVDRRPMRVEQAVTAAQARQVLDKGRYEVVFLAADLQDEPAIELAAELTRNRRMTRVVLLSPGNDPDQTLAALRAGVVDVIDPSAKPKAYQATIRHALDRLAPDHASAERIRRLRKLCKKLNEARIEVSQQVDVLCNDLVTAYQELAVQMQHMVQSTEFGTLIKEELDLEGLIRKTLEHLVEKSGPTNAAIYLPSSADEFSLGGYVNINPDTGEGAGDILLDLIADRIPPTLGDRDEVVHLTDDQAIGSWIGQDGSFLSGTELVAMPCRAEDETLAVLVLFRERSEPFDERILETVEAIGPLLGESLAKVIRVHHRHMGDEPYEGEDDETFSF